MSSRNRNRRTLTPDEVDGMGDETKAPEVETKAPEVEVEAEAEAEAAPKAKRTPARVPSVAPTTYKAVYNGTVIATRVSQMPFARALVDLRGEPKVVAWKCNPPMPADATDEVKARLMNRKVSAELRSARADLGVGEDWPHAYVNLTAEPVAVEAEDK